MVIGYGTIISQDRIIKLCMISKLKSNILQWDGAAVPIKQFVYQIMGPLKINIAEHKIKEVMMKAE